LTDEDRNNIRAFQLKLVGNIPHRVFDRMWQSFRHKMTIDSEWVILCRLATLSGIQLINYDCCINSCIAYTDDYSHHIQCPFCNESCYDAGGRAWQHFSYLPLIPRLQAFFQSPDMIQLLSYRQNYVGEPGIIRDVFDSEWYRTLCQTDVMVDDVKWQHKFFSGKHDIAFSLSVDGFLLFN
ncbi:uncharacterized protein EDB91DRAFT_1009217, partial [Suillus paluster]|uniref:uncharacterized protein n=1 Tax=Suillus paluster TaxID=48578 RepID=UPI001B872231